MNKRQILDSSKLKKKVTGDNSTYDENGEKNSKRRENPVGKKEKLILKSDFSFPTEFSKELYEIHLKILVCLGNG